MSIKTIKINFYITFILAFAAGCKKFLDISAPKTEIVDENVFENSTTANAVAISMYSRMINERAFPYYFSLYTGLYSDELNTATTDAEIRSFYQNSINAKNGKLYGDLWTQGYSLIYQANALIEGIENSNSLQENLKKQLIGEGLFFRAFWHFTLSNLFGDIPVILSTDFEKNRLSPRLGKPMVFQQVIDDLVNARTLLNDNFVGMDGVSVSTERVRINRWAASALLARVYLFRLDYVNAEKLSTEVIEKADLFTLEGALRDVFLKNSKETIWALEPTLNNGYNTPEGNGYIILDMPESGAERNATISQMLLESFEQKDNRRAEWIGAVNGFYFPYKYKIGSSGDAVEYSIVLRLAEQFLIRAEARLELNNIGGCLADLNVIRQRAGLLGATGISKSDILPIIDNERRVELFSEWGHRWMDLKRRGIADQVMSVTAPLKGGDWKNWKQFFPIPETELENNPKLVQNTGY